MKKQMSSVIEFPYQSILLNSKTLSDEVLQELLDMIYSSHPSFTGYTRFSGDDNAALFLLFLEGFPYCGGQYREARQGAFLSIHDFGRELVKSAKNPLSVTLCETDPVLMKGIQLFLQKEPTIKAPTTFIDFESTVHHISKTNLDATIALSRDNNINFFFFKEGKGTLVYYADQSVERPEGMTIDEEMMLYAFQPGKTVNAYIFHDMTKVMPEAVSQVDKESLYKLLTIGYLEKRRQRDAKVATPTTVSGPEAISEALPPKQIPSVVLSIESGCLKGKRLTLSLPCTIGRKDCDVILDDRFISRRHAEIRMVDDLLVIEDLASTNGTMLNGKKITTSSLTVNDLISIGSVDLRILRRKG